MARTKALPQDPDARRSFQQTIDGAALDRLPPQNLEAERGVLSSAILQPFLMDDLVVLLAEDDFYSDAHRQIYIAMKNVHAAGRKLDCTLLHDRLKRSNMLDFVGGLAYLIELTECCPHAANCRYYADIVKECAMRRRVIHATVETLRGAYDEHSPIRDLIATSEQRLADINAARQADSLKIVADVARSRINRLVQKSEPKRGIKSGIFELDRIFDGYECTQLNIIAARTSVGKTALVTSHMAHWLINKPEAVGYVCSLEMSDQELVERILVNLADVDLYRLRNHFCKDDEIQRLHAAFDQFSKSKGLYIDHASNRTVSELLAQARRVKRMAGRLDYVIVDYLQLLDPEPEDRFAKRHEQVAKITRKLKNAAGDLDCPIIALCQLNRESDGNKPRLSHLRESGAIEQDADKVIFIHRSTDDTDAANAMADLIVAKNRHGKVGECKAAFFGSYQRFQGLPADAF